MSLFVAVRPSDRAAEDLQHELDRVRRLPGAADLRWQPPSQWHVTLAFLGAADDAVADAVADRLAAMHARAPVPGLRLSGAGCFGRQVLWLGLADSAAVASLGAIVAAIPPLLRGTGAAVDRRPWRPHLTVARARHGDARTAVDALARYDGPAWDVTEVVLVRSSGGPHPAHHAVARFPLPPHA